ncbi:MAG TPA: hypothetical protein VJ716_02825 [Gaiellaceae bacterium]|nr:hypothetical protein [Gaiellaceae bacterium]
MAKVIAAIAVVCVAAGCGSSSTGSREKKRQPRPSYTLRQIKAAFAAQGIRLQKMMAPGGHHLVILKDSQWDGPFGYQHIDRGESSVKQFLVFVRDGPRSAQRGNVWVAYADGQRSTVNAALHELAPNSGP